MTTFVKFASIRRETRNPDLFIAGKAVDALAVGTFEVLRPGVFRLTSDLPDGKVTSILGIVRGEVFNLNTPTGALGLGFGESSYIKGATIQGTERLLKTIEFSLDDEKASNLTGSFRFLDTSTLELSTEDGGNTRISIINGHIYAKVSPVYDALSYHIGATIGDGETDPVVVAKEPVAATATATATATAGA